MPGVLCNPCHPLWHCTLPALRACMCTVADNSMSGDINEESVNSSLSPWAVYMLADISMLGEIADSRPTLSPRECGAGAHLEVPL